MLGGDNRVTERLHRLAAALREMDNLLARHTYYGRQLVLLHQRLSSIDSLVAWVQALEAEFGHQLRRLRRVRNALTHGGPATSAVVQSVQQFSTPLTRRALDASISAILAGEDVQSAHERAREAHGDWRRNLSLCTTVLPALFPSL
jgi:hypothetical protein